MRAVGSCHGEIVDWCLGFPRVGVARLFDQREDLEVEPVFAKVKGH